MKLIPKISYRPNKQATFKREDDTLKITDNGEVTELDLSGDWIKLEWSENENKGLIRAGVKEDEEPVITITAYQPESRKRLSGQPPIKLKDGESVTFPDYYETETHDA